VEITTKGNVKMAKIDDITKEMSLLEKACFFYGRYGTNYKRSKVLAEFSKLEDIEKLEERHNLQVSLFEVAVSANKIIRNSDRIKDQNKKLEAEITLLHEKIERYKHITELADRIECHACKFCPLGDSDGHCQGIIMQSCRRNLLNYAENGREKQ